MYERFTDRARKVMQLANEEARRLNHEYIGTEHILLGLVKEGAGVAANVLKNLDIDLRKIRLEIEKIVFSGPDMVTMGKLPQTPRAKKVIEYSIEEARNFNHNYVGTEHLLLGLLREQEGVAAQVLMNLGLKLEDVREEVLNILGHDADSADRGGEGQTKRPTPFLDKFGRDLTELARHQALDPVIGRKNEIERIPLVLGCRTQNQPLLVGEVGVGKTAIIHGLARLMVEGPAPEFQSHRRLIAFSFSRTVLQTKDVGQLEEVIKGVVKEVRQSKDILLFLEDFAALVRVGGPYGGNFGARLFGSLLTQEDVPCVATITPEGYQAAIAHDGVFGRRFQPIFVKPASKEEALEILRSWRPLYEDHHRVQIQDDALEAAVELTDRYLTDRCLPGKALRVLDEAGALVHFKKAPPPPDLKQMADQLEQLNQEKENAVAEQTFDKAAQLRDQADKLKKQMNRRAAKWQEQARQVVGSVDRERIVEVVGRITGVPIQRP
jgi:ATP-dependent Clp protease ATP-binding subunit ClpC